VRYEGYRLTPEYRALYEAAYGYAREVVRNSEGLAEGRRRMRWWAALTLLRAVMSSAKSAKSALERRGLPVEDEEALLELAPLVAESAEGGLADEVPQTLVALVGAEGGPRKRLAELRRLAEAVTPEKDAKLQGLLEILEGLLREGHHPVVWCHFVDTAEYVGEAVRARFPEAHVAVVTGRMDGEARREAVEALMEESPRILVATDCVSEGVNLQEGFSAVVHYDLPWNPNRLEQREGRVDRYGQKRPRVVAVRYRGLDNPVDEKVVEVLLKKAERIREALGVHVPVPEEERYVVDRMVRSLFYESAQPLLFAEADLLEERWGRDVERERESRSRFAQRALRPEEALKALEATDAILGSPGEVEAFLLLGAKLAGLEVQRRGGAYEVRPSSEAPEALRVPFRDERGRERPLLLAFTDPPPKGPGSPGAPIPWWWPWPATSWRGPSGASGVGTPPGGCRASPGPTTSTSSGPASSSGAGTGRRSGRRWTSWAWARGASPQGAGQGALGPKGGGQRLRRGGPGAPKPGPQALRGAAGRGGGPPGPPGQGDRGSPQGPEAGGPRAGGRPGGGGRAAPGPVGRDDIGAREVRGWRF
jgi:superfamily II DNA or RNA helicase